MIFRFSQVASEQSSEVVHQIFHLPMSESTPEKFHEVVIGKFLQKNSEKALILLSRVTETHHSFIGFHKVVPVAGRHIVLLMFAWPYHVKFFRSSQGRSQCKESNWGRYSEDSAIVSVFNRFHPRCQLLHIQPNHLPELKVSPPSAQALPHPDVNVVDDTTPFAIGTGGNVPISGELAKDPSPLSKIEERRFCRYIQQ